MAVDCGLPRRLLKLPTERLNQTSWEQPELPRVGDFVPGYESSQWYGIGAPKNTSGEIVDKLNKEINAALADPRMKARLADIGGEVLVGSPAEFGRLIAAETEKWAKVVKLAGIKAD
jgi:tripartite-type tricarboxylate transporter receptor subunit TctC